MGFLAHCTFESYGCQVCKLWCKQAHGKKGPSDDFLTGILLASSLLTPNSFVSPLLKSCPE